MKKGETKTERTNGPFLDPERQTENTITPDSQGCLAPWAAGFPRPPGNVWTRTGRGVL